MNSKTLNYWLGKLNRLQLFGHGTQPVCFKIEGKPEVYEISKIAEDKERTTIYLK